MPSRALIQAPRSLGSAVGHHAFAPCLRSPVTCNARAVKPLRASAIILHLLSIKIAEPGGWHPCLPSRFVKAPSHAQVVRPAPLCLQCHSMAAVVLSHLHGRSMEETWRPPIRSDVTAPWLARRHPSTPWPAPVRLAEAHAIHSPDLGRYSARIPSSAASKEQENPPSSSTSGPAQLQRRHGIQRTYLRSNRSPDQRL